MTPRTSLTLLNGILAGGEEYWLRLSNIYGPEVQRLARRYGLRAEDADEVAQEVLMKVFTKIGQFDRSRGSFTSWFRTIAHHECVNLIRSRSKHVDAIGGTNAHEMLQNAAEKNRMDVSNNNASSADADFCNPSRITSRVRNAILNLEANSGHKEAYMLITEGWTAAAVLAEMATRGIDLKSAANIYKIKSRIEKQIREELRDLFDNEPPGGEE